MDPSTLSYTSLIVSIVSVALAAGALTWTIRRDVLKPRLKVTLRVIENGDRPEHKILLLEASNRGPGYLVIRGWSYRQTRWRRWLRRIPPTFNPRFVALPQLAPLFDGPVRLEEQEVFRLGIDYSRNCILSLRELESFGLLDGFERYQGVSRKEWQRAVEKYREDFGS